MAGRPAKQGTATPVAERLHAVRGAVAEEATGDDDRLIYDRIRLGIMSALSVNRKMSFSELRDLLQATDGNLSKHARKLEDAGYITCRKGFSGRIPKTEYSLTARGKRAFARHLRHMEALIAATRPD